MNTTLPIDSPRSPPSEPLLGGPAASSEGAKRASFVVSPFDRPPFEELLATLIARVEGLTEASDARELCVRSSATSDPVAGAHDSTSAEDSNAPPTWPPPPTASTMPTFAEPGSAPEKLVGPVQLRSDLMKTLEEASASPLASVSKGCASTSPSCRAGIVSVDALLVSDEDSSSSDRSSVEARRFGAEASLPPAPGDPGVAGSSSLTAPQTCVDALSFAEARVADTSNSKALASQRETGPSPPSSTSPQKARVGGGEAPSTPASTPSPGGSPSAARVATRVAPGTDAVSPEAATTQAIPEPGAVDSERVLAEPASSLARVFPSTASLDADGSSAARSFASGQPRADMGGSGGSSLRAAEAGDGPDTAPDPLRRDVVDGERAQRLARKEGRPWRRPEEIVTSHRAGKVKLRSASISPADTKGVPFVKDALRDAPRPSLAFEQLAVRHAELAAQLHQQAHGAQRVASLGSDADASASDRVAAGRESASPAPVEADPGSSMDAPASPATGRGEHAHVMAGSTTSRIANASLARSNAAASHAAGAAPASGVQAGASPSSSGASATVAARQTSSHAVVEQVVSRLAALQPGGRVTIALDPERLGRVLLRFVRRGNEWTVRLVTEHPDAAAALARDLPRLEHALARGGESFRIEIGHASQDAATAHHEGAEAHARGGKDDSAQAWSGRSAPQGREVAVRARPLPVPRLLDVMT